MISSREHQIRDLDQSEIDSVAGGPFDPIWVIINDLLDDSEYGTKSPSKEYRGSGKSVK